jgi:hypothetical protein
MIFNSKRLGPEGLTADDQRYQGSRFAEVYSAIFKNSYYLVWGGGDEPPLPVYGVRLRRALKGLLQRRWQFQAASDRSVDSHADLRWGSDGLGFRRILHPNAVCLVGQWSIDGPESSPYSGYFAPGSRGLVIGRYSVCCTETRRGRSRSLSLVGKLYPTLDRNDPAAYRPANFITQEDLGGSTSRHISDVELRNAPDVTPWRRGSGIGVFLVTGLVLRRTDVKNTIRQLYEVAELGTAKGTPIKTPTFMRLTTDPAAGGDDHPDLDFRDEILGRIYDRGNATARRTLTFHIEVSDTGTKQGLLRLRRDITGWRRIGRIEFSEAVASYNGDFVLHYRHPAWRNDPNDPSSVVANRRRAAREQRW